MLQTNNIDLHVHSNVSDGTLTPTKLVQEAKQKGLRAFALTDHDTIHGIKEAKAAALSLKEQEAYDLEVVSGVEISAGYGKGDIHILGLLIDETSPKLRDTLSDVEQERDTRNKKMADKLAKAGIPITIEALYKEFPDSILTRAHFAEYLYKKEIVKDIQTAFTKYLSETGPYYLKRNYLSPEEAVALILEAGGIPILAHPLIYHLTEAELKNLIVRLKDAGLIGLEAIHSTNVNNDESYLRGLAHKYDLAISGGSDFHGNVKPDIQLGCGRGNLAIPYTVLEQLKQFKSKPQ